MLENESTVDLLNAEFNAMDKNNQGKLSSADVCEILIYQGIFLDERFLNRNLFEKYGDLITKDEFQKFMKHIPNRTRNLRTIFQSFHTEHDNYASKKSILEGLVKMGVSNGQSLTNQMEITDDNGLVSYESFLRVYFNSK
ncbi:calcium-binding mitochondrial carrier protein SCaMC-1-like [Argonauta hians]